MDGGQSSTRKIANLSDLIDGFRQFDIIAIDVPIGLLDCYQSGGRECDRLARRRLGQARGRSVCPALLPGVSWRHSHGLRSGSLVCARNLYHFSCRSHLHLSTKHCFDLVPRLHAPHRRAALKESIESRGRAKVRDAVRRRMGKPSAEEKPRPRPSRPGPSPRRMAH